MRVAVEGDRREERRDKGGARKVLEKVRSTQLHPFGQDECHPWIYMAFRRGEANFEPPAAEPKILFEIDKRAPTHLHIPFDNYRHGGQPIYHLCARNRCRQPGSDPLQADHPFSVRSEAAKRSWPCTAQMYLLDPKVL